MSEERRKILAMLAEGKITTEEAERLLAAVGESPGRSDGDVAPRRRNWKYLRVLVDADDDHSGPTKVNIRVPMQLIRAGVKLSGVIPPEARTKINAAMREKGVDFDLNQVKPENLEEFMDQLNELTVDVDNEKAKVRIFCE